MACNNRVAINTGMDGAIAQPMRADDIEAKPGKQGAAPSHAIRKRAVDELAHGHAEEEDGDRERGLALTGVHVARQLGQARQIHVDRHRPERGQEAENERQKDGRRTAAAGFALRRWAQG